MHVLVLHHWQEVTTEFTQTLATILGLTAYDARQRLVGKGPAVISCLADAQQARILLSQLKKCGFKAFLIDVSHLKKEQPFTFVRRFKMDEETLHIEGAVDIKASIDYKDVKLLLPVLRTKEHTESNIITEKKFSMGKTLMAGGLPMKKKVKRQEVSTVADYERALYLCTKNRVKLVCPQDGLLYDGLGQEMKHSRELNFNVLVTALRQRCTTASYDDRLLKRAEQVKLLGPILSPESNIDLAVNILEIAADQE